jgi:hypothetical protein
MKIHAQRPPGVNFMKHFISFVSKSHSDTMTILNMTLLIMTILLALVIGDIA